MTCTQRHNAPSGGYRFCPYCAGRLETRIFDGRRLPTCPACGFIHFPDPKVAVIGLVEYNAQVLLIRRGVAPARGRWALPGGFMDAGEMPDSALQREMREEVGLTVRIGPLLDTFALYGSDERRKGVVLAFSARPASVPPPPLACRDDAEAAGWFTPDNLPSNLAFDSTVTLVNAWRRRTTAERTRSASREGELFP